MVGLTNPNPPRCAGRARSLRSRSEGGALPVRAGSGWSLMQSLSGCSSGPIIAIILPR